jgi:LuxR family transcriptional regulator, maltose regulon positive regulatory protein
VIIVAYGATVRDVADSEADAALAAGQEALAAGAWDSAREHYQRAVDAEATAEALEGLSWAAWWLDDASAVFDARGRAYKAYRAAGDVHSAARVAVWMAIDSFDFDGALAVANGWLQRAHRLLDGLETAPAHGWLAMQEGYLSRAQGDNERAAELAARASEIGRRFDIPDLEMLGLAVEGSALVSAAAIGEGMRCLDEATALALEGDAQVPISSAWTCCFMVTSCAAVRDYERAAGWCDRIAEFAERWGSRYMLAFCTAEYGAIHLWRGRWQEAEELLTGAVEHFGESRPAMAGTAIAALAELRRRQGRRQEAEELLDRAGPLDAAELCRAGIALDEREAEKAADLLDRLLRRTHATSADSAVPVLEMLIEARVATGEIDAAEVAAKRLGEIAEKLATPPLRASHRLALARIAGCRGDHDVARRFAEDAVDSFRQAGAPYETARARLDLAASLTALGRRDDAAREASGALAALTRLGAEQEAMSARDLLAAGRAAPAREDRVTPREREVLGLLAKGLTNRQIADRLVVSEHTVHRHVTNILRKLDVPSRSAAAAEATRSGILDRPAAE